MVEIENLIAAISPDVYCHDDVRKDVKKIIKEKGKDGYLEAAKIAKPVEESHLVTTEDIKANPLDAPGLKYPSEIHKLVYDSPSESLEPIYFWLHDFILTNGYKKIDKITDNFVSSPGSSHFSELGQKATKMQEEAMKTLGAVNQVLKSILNIVYDLKEFKLRLELYDKYKKGTEEEKNAALLSLKQVWLDNVDFAKRQSTSIKALAQQFDYVTLIDGFMSARSLDDVTKKPEEGGLDLNERVRRILQQRIAEFYQWLGQSDIELRKRFEIEKKYLQSQYNTIQLYARWVKPYLKAARQLEQNLEPTAGLVTAFNTIILELTWLAQTDYNPNDDVFTGDLPEMFKNTKKRKYTNVVLVEFKFRGIPQRAGQGYTFGGRTEISFTSYGLSEQELKVLKEQIEKDNFSDILKIIEGATTESLEQIKNDIEEFIESKEEKEKKEKSSYEEDANPFTALFSFFKPGKKKEEKDKEFEEKGIIKPDDAYEKIIRSQAIANARDGCKLIFETFKKSRGMPTW